MPAPEAIAAKHEWRLSFVAIALALGMASGFHSASMS
jgi:hypothetical protein